METLYTSFLRGTVEPLPTFKRATEDAGPAEFRGVKTPISLSKVSMAKIPEFF